MRFSFNIKKRDVFALLGMIVLVGFVIAQTPPNPPNPGHSGNDIQVTGVAGYPTLSVWSDWIQKNVSNLLNRVNILEVNPPKAEVGAEFSVGSGTTTIPAVGNVVGWRRLEFTLRNNLNAIQRVRVRLNSTLGSNVNTGSCPEMILDASNNFQATCNGAGLTSFLSTSSQCDTPANTDWFSVDLYGLNSTNYKSRIDRDGISKLVVILCDDSPNTGSVSFEVYVTPYAYRIDDRRLQTYIPPNSLIFTSYTGT